MKFNFAEIFKAIVINWSALADFLFSIYALSRMQDGTANPIRFQVKNVVVWFYIKRVAGKWVVEVKSETL